MGHINIISKSVLLFSILSLFVFVIASFSSIPAANASHNSNLFVSAENPFFDNYMSGSQVIEVVIIDSTIDDIDIPRGEPDVTVNGKALRMVQAIDGNWYGYFADRTHAQIADETVDSAGVAGVGLDYGTFCPTTTDIGDNNFVVDISDTVGIAVPGTSSGGIQGTDIIPGSSPCIISSVDNLNVVREEKQINQDPNVEKGQIGVNPNAWPFIQLYNLTPTGNVVVEYNKGGGAQTVVLTFDTVEQFAGISLDRSKYPRASQVHVIVTDLWLNIDPTDEDSWTFGTNAADGLSTNYQVFNEDGGLEGAGVPGGIIDISSALPNLMVEDNGILRLNVDVQAIGSPIVTLQDNNDIQITCNDPQDPSTCSTDGPATGLGANSQPVTLTETGGSSGVFVTFDEQDISSIVVPDNAPRGFSATIDYNETPLIILVGFEFATIDIQAIDGEWNSGEEVLVTLVDGDANKNTKLDEDLDLFNPKVDLIPALQVGNPFTLESLSSAELSGNPLTVADVQLFSQRALLDASVDITIQDGNSLVLTLGKTFADLYNTINDPTTSFRGFNYFNYDIRSIQNSLSDGNIVSFDIDITDGTKTSKLADDITLMQNMINLATATGDDVFGMTDTSPIQIVFTFDVGTDGTIASDLRMPIVADFFSFGIINDGVLPEERINNMIVRLELEETGDNTGTFVGTLEYTLLNQLNILDQNTYDSVFPIADDPSFIVIEGLIDENSPRVIYFDLGADGVPTAIADQEEAPTHSGIVSFDSSVYKVGETVTITLVDKDLDAAGNDLIDIYAPVSPVLFPTDPARDTVGKQGLGVYTSAPFGAFGRVLDITFDGERWTSGLTENGGACGQAGIPADGLFAAGFTLVETGAATGIFKQDFTIPETFCQESSGTIIPTTGTDMVVTYVDFRDASNQIVEVGDSAGIHATTGSVSLDRTSYPVPFGSVKDFFPTQNESDSETPNGDSIFPVHLTGVTSDSDLNIDVDVEEIGPGDLIIHVRVNDVDFDVNSSDEDAIALGNNGPVKILVNRGPDTLLLATAGGIAKNDGVITHGTDVIDQVTREVGPMVEIAHNAGIFEIDFPIRYTDGPSGQTCPVTPDDGYTSLNGISGPLGRFDLPPQNGAYCILSGDLISVEYTDPVDASGNPNTVTDDAAFTLRSGVLQADKSVYQIGSDMILTLIDPDLDLDNDSAETYDLDLIEWNSDAATLTIGDLGGETAAFDPAPLDFRETGDSTGIFQVVIEIPQELKFDKLERGEVITLEYNDWGTAGGDYVGQIKEDINLTIFTSNFGATVKLDQKVYTWTDKVFITIVAPDHNFDSDLIDSIGETNLDPIRISTRGFDLANYELVETGTDTGTFSGEVTLTGFCHDADGDTSTGDDGTGGCAVGDDTNPTTSGSGPTDGLLASDSDDGITVSFEFSEDQTVVGSALIRWNIGELQWSKASYTAEEEGKIHLVDPDMNLNPELFDIFAIDVWSDTDTNGIQLFVVETGIATGIFENDVTFTTTGESSGHTLKVSEHDTITAEYGDNTLPDPFTPADELDITATTVIDSNPPANLITLENARIADAFGNILNVISVGQQVLVVSDITNQAFSEQPFSYAVIVRDENGVLVSESWLSGFLSVGQSFSPALSLTPAEVGNHLVRVELWNNPDERELLDDPIELTVDVVEQLQAQTDQSLYEHGDLIMVSGSVNPVQPGFPVTIQVLNPDNDIVLISQVAPALDGTFESEFVTSGALWSVLGEYTINVSYGSATTQLTFTLEDTTSPEITAPANQTFEATAVNTPLTELDYGTATASDIFRPVTVSSDAPTTFPLGDTTITWTATDANGNVSTATQLVTIDILNTIPGKGQNSDVNEFLVYGVITETTIQLDPGTTTFDLLLRYGSTTNPSSFTATLNRIDITSDFSPSPDSPDGVILSLKDGRNVLVLSIEGQKPSGVTSQDTDRLVFKVG